jgi:hypothetical protein
MRDVFKALSRALPDVRQQLDKEVLHAPRPLIVAQEPDEREGGAFDKRLPYRYLLEHNAQVSIVVITDHPIDGLWRDPLGELADRLFRNRRQAVEAVAGFILLIDGEQPSYIKRDLWDRMADVRALIQRLHLDIPLPPLAKQEPKWTPGRSKPPPPVYGPEDIVTDPGFGDRSPRVKLGDDDADESTVKDIDPRDDPLRPRRPAGPRFRPNSSPGTKGPSSSPPPSSAPEQEEWQTRATVEFEANPRKAPPPPTPPAPKEEDPFAVLGLKPSANEEAVRKAFRDLIVQYHPDKVAHLGPEFRDLAEKKSRELTAAYEAAQKRLRGG